MATCDAGLWRGLDSPPVPTTIDPHSIFGTYMRSKRPESDISGASLILNSSWLVRGLQDME